MSWYLLTYDLIKNKDYSKLYALIKKYPGYVKILDSVWLIQASQTPEQIYNYIKQNNGIDNDDCIFITELSGKSYWYLDREISDFLNKNLY